MIPLLLDESWRLEYITITEYVGVCSLISTYAEFLRYILLFDVRIGTKSVQHYEQCDTRYMGMMPQKRVYVPEPLEEAET